MDVPHFVLDAFPPSVTALLDCARAPIDDEMLMQVARADYGNMAEELFAALKPIRDSAEIPKPLAFWLREVLSLTRWSDPDSPQPPPFEPGPTGLKGHQIRLFVCAVLLKASSQNKDPDDSDDSSLAQGLRSARRLGEEVNFAFAQFLTWRLESGSALSDYERPPWLAALLVEVVRSGRKRFSEGQLGELADEILADVERARAEEPWATLHSRLRYFSVESGFWTPLLEEVRSAAAAFTQEELRRRIDRCAAIMDCP